MVAVDRVDHQECHRDVPGSTAREKTCSEGDSSIPDIQILGATAFDDRLASEQLVGIFCQRVGDSTGLWGATVKRITNGEWDMPQVLDGEAGSSVSSYGGRASRIEP